MSNRPHSHIEQAEPQLSDVRSQTPAAGPSSSALSRRNATRTSRRNEAHRSWETSRARIRRIQNLGRVGREPSPSGTPSEEERSAKRRRLERSGQVEMEQLSMELRYCDGGRYDGGHLHPYPRNSYTPESALLDDDSVYCTKNSHCNMILRHVDGHCFSLQQLVIRAPMIGFTSPVKAGMIFVTMEETDLLSRTSYYTFHDVQDVDGDDGSDSDSGEFRLSRSDPCEDAEVDLSTPPHFLTDSESVGTPRRDAPSSSSLWTNLSEHINLSRPPPPVQLVPQAIFRHKEKKAQWTIDFEPAISGRYIVAKFFSTGDQKNIDIEFIGAYGWVGRRFFPAVNPR